MKNILFVSIFIFMELLTLKVFTQNNFNFLQSVEEFEKKSGAPLTGKYGMTKAIKIAYDLKSEKIYYIDPNKYIYHYEFCVNELGLNMDLSNFNEQNYSNDTRRKFLLGNINYFKDINKYALEISPTDLMPLESVIVLFNKVSNTSFIKDNLYFLLNNPRLDDDKEIKRIKTLSPSEIYKNLSYQAISNSENVGRLRFINDLKSEEKTIAADDIIVLNETPLTLPEVAGIIITEFQTPLSHLTILGRNRKIPIAVIKDAFKDSILKSMVNERVLLKVKKNSYELERTKKTANKSINRKKIKLKYNLEVDSLIDVKLLDKKSYKYAGNKASNFGVLHQLSLKNDFKVPESAFSIPFYFYNQHIEGSNTRVLIDLLKKTTNKDSIKICLKAIRNNIKSFPVDSQLISSVNKKTTNKGFERFRFRSSTNAEDAKGFSGAGLYTSKTGILNDCKKSYEKAIKKVWASLWSEKAYLEREYYNINHDEVFMGILVHRSFPNEKVNGVAITKNLYRLYTAGFVVNAQIGNENVVSPTKGVIADQFICYPKAKEDIYKNKIVIDVITQSSLNDDKLTMSRVEIQKLANQLDIIKKHFHKGTGKFYFSYGLDVEFKLDKEERELYIKQVRFFNN